MATTLGVLAAGFLLMLPRAYCHLADDAIAQVAMLANVRFWQTTDYFAVAADLRFVHSGQLDRDEPSSVRPSISSDSCRRRPSTIEA